MKQEQKKEFKAKFLDLLSQIKEVKKEIQIHQEKLESSKSELRRVEEKMGDVLHSLYKADDGSMYTELYNTKTYNFEIPLIDGDYIITIKYNLENKSIVEVTKKEILV